MFDSGIIKNSTPNKKTLQTSWWFFFLIQLIYFSERFKLWKYMLSTNLYDLSILIQHRVPGRQALSPNKQDLPPDEELSLV